MKRLKPWIIAALAATLALSVIASVSAQPRPPAFFEGTVTDADGPVPAGLSVVAEIGGQDCSASPATTYVRDGVTRYTVLVNSSSTTTGCGTPSSEMRFKVGDRYAVETRTWSNSPPRQTLNLTLAPQAVNVDVTVWESVSSGRVYISTRPQGGGWTTHNTPVDLSNLSSSGRFYQGEGVTIAVDVGGGVIANVDVTVWESVRTGNIYVSTRPEGGSWTTHNTPVDLSNLSSSGRFYQGVGVTVEVQLR